MATILIIEENPEFKKRLTEGLLPIHRVTFCRCPADAAEPMRKAAYDIVICDLPAKLDSAVSFIRKDRKSVV